jgi:ABC-type amino acid transport substrate-binding protein
MRRSSTRSTALAGTTLQRSAAQNESAPLRSLLDGLIRTDPRGRFSTVTDIARAAGLAASTLSMVTSGKRPLTDEVAYRLAKQLARPDQPSERILEDLLAAGRPADSFVPSKPNGSNVLRKFGSVADRVRANRRINVGYITNPPFVSETGDGFAMDFSHYLERIMGLEKSNMQNIRTFREIPEMLNSGEIDLLVTGLLPTFQRQKVMSFSQNFPYLRVPLTGLVRKTNHLQNLKFSDLLREDLAIRLDSVPQVPLRILHLAGEVGEEFGKAFVNPKLWTKSRINSTYSTKIDEIADELLASGDLLLADVGTCLEVMNYLDRTLTNNPFEPLEDTDADSSEAHAGDEDSDEAKGFLGSKKLGMVPRTYFYFALYPVAFGIKKLEPEWEQELRDAFHYMMSEGLRATLLLYQNYFPKRPSPGNWSHYLNTTIREPDIPGFAANEFERRFKEPEHRREPSKEDRLGPRRDSAIDIDSKE